MSVRFLHMFYMLRALTELCTLQKASTNNLTNIIFRQNYNEKDVIRIKLQCKDIKFSTFFQIRYIHGNQMALFTDALKTDSGIYKILIQFLLFNNIPPKIALKYHYRLIRGRSIQFQLIRNSCFHWNEWLKPESCL